MKVGFVAVVGRPNVGKSSLMNAILKWKVAITTNVPQTTRNLIKGIYNDYDSQIIFLDTPGIHKPKQKLSEHLNQFAYKSIKDADLVLFLQPLNEKIGPGDRRIIDVIQHPKKIAVITKIDQGNEAQAQIRAQELKQSGFDQVVGVSINMEASINHLLNFIKTKLPVAAPFYNQEIVSDVSLRFLAQEFIREATIENTKQEVPHSIGVVIDDFKEKSDEQKILAIYATIFVERNSQKGIIIGKNRHLIKKISMMARSKIEDNFGEKIFLKLRVKVDKNWTENSSKIKKMGY